MQTISVIFLRTIVKSIRKMSSFKGVPMEDIYRGTLTFELDHLPPIVNKRDHIVLYQLPLRSDAVPKPHFGNQKWDSHHVKMPCAVQNEYKTESAIDPSKRVTVSRWEKIESALLGSIKSSHDLQQAILSYNPKYATKWKFRSLHKLFNEVLEDEEAESFFTTILPPIAMLALRLPELLPAAIPLLKRGENKSISLSQQQIACILANGFFCTFPRRNEGSSGAEYSTYPSINFSSLYQTTGDQNMEKIKCLCNYFRRVCSQMPTGVMTFTRRSISASQLPDWEDSKVNFRDTLLHVSHEGTIEDDGKGLLQVDFANKYLGGGVLNYGCVQEEIRFVICPELLCSLLFTEMLSDNECLVMVGCEQFNDYSGYASSFEWAGDFKDETPIDANRRRKCAIVAIDAIRFHDKTSQYKENMMKRELNKAFVGFKHNLDTPAPGVATGNWGCGAFNGDKYLKSLIQLMACCINERPMVYFTFGDDLLRDQLFLIHEYLSNNHVTIAELWSFLKLYGQQKSDNHLYQFIIQCHQDSRKRKSSTNEIPKQGNRSNSHIQPKEKPKPPPTEIENEIEPDYTIETTSDEDQQYTVDEAEDHLRQSEAGHRTPRKKPCDRRLQTTPKSTGTASRTGTTIQRFFHPKPTENQEKRPRASLLGSLDEDYYRKSPAKVKKMCTSTSCNNEPSTNCSPDEPKKDQTVPEENVDEIESNIDFDIDSDPRMSEGSDIPNMEQNTSAMSPDILSEAENSSPIRNESKTDKRADTAAKKKVLSTPKKSVAMEKERMFMQNYFSPNRDVPNSSTDSAAPNNNNEQKACSLDPIGNGIIDICSSSQETESMGEIDSALNTETNQLEALHFAGDDSDVKVKTK